MFTRPLSPEGPFGQFADRLLEIELPELPDDRRFETVAFNCRRAAQVPTPLRLGIAALSIGVGAAAALMGLPATTSWLQQTRLPFIGELARMVRSLSFAYVWETWPHTWPDGSPGTAVAS